LEAYIKWGNDETVSNLIQDKVFGYQEVIQNLHNLVDMWLDQSFYMVLKFDYINWDNINDKMKYKLIKNKMYSSLYYLYKSWNFQQTYFSFISVHDLIDRNFKEDYLLELINSDLISLDDLVKISPSILLKKWYIYLLKNLIKIWKYSKTDFDDKFKNNIKDSSLAILSLEHWIISYSYKDLKHIKSYSRNLFYAIIDWFYLQRGSKYLTKDITRMIGKEHFVRYIVRSWRVIYTYEETIVPLVYSKINKVYFRNKLSDFDSSLFEYELYIGIKNSVEKARKLILEETSKKDFELWIWFKVVLKADYKTFSDVVDIIDLFTWAKKKVLKGIIEETSEKTIWKKLSKETSKKMVEIILLITTIVWIVIWILLSENKNEKKD
jgi:hypothetical protein